MFGENSEIKKINQLSIQLVGRIHQESQVWDTRNQVKESNWATKNNTALLSIEILVV